MTEITLLPVSETDGRHIGILLAVSILTHVQLSGISLKFGRQIDFHFFKGVHAVTKPEPRSRSLTLRNEKSI